MSDFQETPLRRGHRCASEANTFEASRSWRKAMYKHQQASESFTQCLGLTGHPQANKAILLLISKHSKRFEEIRDKLAYNKSLKTILLQNGYNNHTNLNKINDEIYTDLREQMQRIVSYSHKKLIISNTDAHTTNTIIINDNSDINEHKSQISQYLEQCDVRKSVNIANNQMNINKRKIVLNDNFFNPDHETQSKKQLIERNRQLCESIKTLNGQLKSQSECMSEYQNEITNKVQTLRQTLDHLYNTNNPINTVKKGKENEKSRAEMDLRNKNLKIEMDKKLREERDKWESDKDKLRNIHAKQMQELKKKIKDWMEYAKKQEQHAKIYKKQLQMLHSKSKKKQLVGNKSAGKGQMYQRGTLSRAKQNIIPETQVINENDEDV